MVQIGQTMSTGLFETRPAVWEFSTSGEIVLKRFVALGVSYQRPPLPSGWPVWTRVRGGQIEYTMSFPSLPDAAFSLGEYCRSLRAQQSVWQQYRCGQDEPPEPLAKLDAIADKILELASHLHEAGWGLGLITPDNILVFETEGQLKVSFADLGFSWGDEQPIVPPNFMRTVSEGNPMAQLWDSGDPQAQLERGGPIPPDRFDPKPDVRALVRVFITALLQQTNTEYFASVPSPDVRPETSAQLPGIRAGRRVWWTLTELLSEAPSIEEFRRALRETPLSQHYMAEAPVSRRRVWLGGVAVVGVVLLGLGGALAYYSLWSEKKLPDENSVAGTQGAVSALQGGDAASSREDGGEKSFDLERRVDDLCQRCREAQLAVWELYRQVQQLNPDVYFDTRQKLRGKRKEVEQLRQEVESLLEEIDKQRTLSADTQVQNTLTRLHERLTECRQLLFSLEPFWSEGLE